MYIVRTVYRCIVYAHALCTHTHSLSLTHTDTHTDTLSLTHEKRVVKVI